MSSKLPVLEGERLIELRYGGEETCDDYCVRVNVIKDQLVLCFTTDGKSVIDILDERECRNCIIELLQKYNWERREQMWKLVFGETTTHDIWNIGDDGSSFTVCKECGGNIWEGTKQYGERLCSDCEEDRKNGVPLECDWFNNITPVNGTFIVDTTPSREQVVGMGAENIVIVKKRIVKKKSELNI